MIRQELESLLAIFWVGTYKPSCVHWVRKFVKRLRLIANQSLNELNNFMLTVTIFSVHCCRGFPTTRGGPTGAGV